MFFHAVVRVSYLKCLRFLLFHAPMAVSVYSSPINPVGSLKIFGYFYYTYLFWSLCKCKLWCKRSLYTQLSRQIILVFKIAIKTSRSSSLCGPRDAHLGYYVFTCWHGLVSVLLHFFTCLTMHRGILGSLACSHGPDITYPLQLLFHLTVQWSTQAQGETSMAILSTRSYRVHVSIKDMSTHQNRGTIVARMRWI